MNALQVLKEYGFPKGIDNTRIKPFVMYDARTPAAITNFFRTAPTNFISNKQFPLASDETILIDTIKVLVNNLTAFSDFPQNIFELFANCYLEVTINETQKIKLPLWEVINFGYSDVFGTGAGVQRTNHRIRNKAKKLKYPIILFKNANVSFKIVLSTGALNNFQGGGRITLELSGVKLDFINPNELDPIASNKYEKLSVTLYNTVAAVNAETTYNLFSDRNTADNLINKTFPLSETEVFSLEAVEVLAQSRAATSYFKTVLDTFTPSMLRININSTDFYFGQNYELFSMIYGAASVNVVDSAGNTLPLTQNVIYENAPVVYGFLDKGVPIIIPGQTQVSVQLIKPATTEITDFICVMLKGTLERRIS